MSFIFVFLRFEIAKSNSGQCTYKDHISNWVQSHFGSKAKMSTFLIFHLKIYLIE